VTSLSLCAGGGLLPPALRLPLLENETAQACAERTTRKPVGADIEQAKVRSKQMCGKAVPENASPARRDEPEMRFPLFRGRTLPKLPRSMQEQSWHKILC
jgi:hypothetical protein